MVFKVTLFFFFLALLSLFTRDQQRVPREAASLRWWCRPSSSSWTRGAAEWRRQTDEATSSDTCSASTSRHMQPHRKGPHLPDHRLRFQNVKAPRWQKKEKKKKKRQMVLVRGSEIELRSFPQFQGHLDQNNSGWIYCSGRINVYNNVICF